MRCAQRAKRCKCNHVNNNVMYTNSTTTPAPPRLEGKGSKRQQKVGEGAMMYRLHAAPAHVPCTTNNVQKHWNVHVQNKNEKNKNRKDQQAKERTGHGRRPRRGKRGLREDRKDKFSFSFYVRLVQQQKDSTHVPKRYTYVFMLRKDVQQFPKKMYACSSVQKDEKDVQKDNAVLQKCRAHNRSPAQVEQGTLLFVESRKMYNKITICTIQNTSSLSRPRPLPSPHVARSSASSAAS